MLVVYFFIGLVILIAVWFVSFSYRQKRLKESSVKKEIPRDDDDVMYK